jgi:hypothetical protein
LTPSSSFFNVQFILLSVPLPMPGSFFRNLLAFEALIPAGRSLLQDGGQETIRGPGYDASNRRIAVLNALPVKYPSRQCGRDRRGGSP